MLNRYQVIFRRKEAIDKLAEIYYSYEEKADYIGMEETNNAFEEFNNTF